MKIFHFNKENFFKMSIEIIQINNSNWSDIKEKDYLFASRLVRDARDLRNLTFKKTEKDFK